MNHKGMRRKNTDEYRKNERNRISADVEAFLASGGKVQEVPTTVYKQVRLTKRQAEKASF